MIQTIKNAWKVPELRSKILFTLLVILLYRLGANIGVPFLNSLEIERWVGMTSNSIFGFMNMLSGGAFAQATVFALNVSPYITASIVIQLLTVALPPLERWAKDGEAGRKKISALTRVVTVALALITAVGYTMLLDSNNLLTRNDWFAYVVIIACFCAGSSLIMWLAEKINEFGIGNGISVILFANILAGVFGWLDSLWSMTFASTGFNWVGLLISLGSIVAALAMMVLIVWFTESERRIPIQYAKRQVGRKMYGGQSSNLPLKMNMAGVMPVIFASSIASIPATIATFIQNENNWFYKFANNWFAPDTVIYLVVSVILIFLFSYFYIMISFNPVEVANNIKNQGGSVPGIRPGKPTSDYIQKILGRITTLGAVFLAFVAGIPMLISIINKLLPEGTIALPGIAFAGTSMLIVVGVALEIFRSLESQLAMRNYKGFLD